MLSVLYFTSYSFLLLKLNKCQAANVREESVRTVHTLSNGS